MQLVVEHVDLGPRVRAVFTGRATAGAADPAPADTVGLVGNLSASQPHRPTTLAAARRAAATAVGLSVDDLVWMHQVHAADVGIVDDAVPAGGVVATVDALVTSSVNRGLAVQAADCVPVLLASPDVVAVAHAGRRGLQAGVVDAVLDSLRSVAGDGPVRAAVGPAIRGCCYEVEDWLRDEVSQQHPATWASTSWGTPSLDLAAGVVARLEDLQVEVTDLAVCTLCDDRFFSHRSEERDTGRHAGIITLTAPIDAQPVGAGATGSVQTTGSVGAADSAGSTTELHA